MFRCDTGKSFYFPFKYGPECDDTGAAAVSNYVYPSINSDDGFNSWAIWNEEGIRSMAVAVYYKIDPVEFSSNDNDDNSNDNNMETTNSQQEGCG